MLVDIASKANDVTPREFDDNFGLIPDNLEI